MNRDLHYVVFAEDGVFVARCLDVEVASDGSTESQAIAHLKEALELYYEDRQACLEELPPRTYRVGAITIPT